MPLKDVPDWDSILQESGHRTSKALPFFVPKLRDDGYEFVAVSELVSLGSTVTMTGCYELKAEDNLGYDKIFGAGTD